MAAPLRSFPHALDAVRPGALTLVARTHAADAAPPSSGPAAADAPTWTKDLTDLGYATTASELSQLDDNSALIARTIVMQRKFEMRGHFEANTDPLGLEKKFPLVSKKRMAGAEQFPKTLEEFGFTEAEKKKKVSIAIPNGGGLLGERYSRQWEIAALYNRLRDVYCSDIGAEITHVESTEKLRWLKNALETPEPFRYSPAQKRQILERVVRAVQFEKFAGLKFATVKRFGLDGCEGFVVGLDELLKTGVKGGVESVVLSMAHRGRLNTLANIFHKPLDQMFSEFMGHTGFGNAKWGNIGDVKYHMGAEIRVRDENAQRDILYTMLPNPSHLEAVDPVCLGTARARQDFYRLKLDGTSEEKWKQSVQRVVPVIVHGDASIAGQGVVYETSQMTALPKYSVGGTIHVVINNQIGFTTNPGLGSSGDYCTDVAKCIGAPVFHVNGDRPEAVTRAMQLAMDYRQEFGSDVFIDIVGYRRSGHNELDMPKFTQPQMYTKIEKHPNVMDLYGLQMVKENVITAAEFEKLKTSVFKEYNDAFESAKKYAPQARLRPFNSQWLDQMLPSEYSRPRITGMTTNGLVAIGKAVTQLPNEGKNCHPTIQRVYKQRADALDQKNWQQPIIDFGFAEALAFGSLLQDGVHIRLMGQDVERGTFSHRHAKLFEQQTATVGQHFFPLKAAKAQLKLPGSITIGNSLLSEYGALGFEYGYSLESPNVLPIWEAQFGDFANGAQVMIDQFIVSGETKWAHPSGLTLMLPHGYDGQGSEHSSGRMERFLQMCDDREDLINPESWDLNRRSVIQQHNIQVVNVSTPASLFHVLRRQIHRGFRKPLIIFTPKRLLRLKEACSSLQDMTENTRFSRYISDPGFVPMSSDLSVEAKQGPEAKELKQRTKAQRLILCSGQVYYDLVKARAEAGLENEVIISRVEQISPLPYDRLLQDILSAPYLQSIVWCQEEPMNMGAWSYVNPRLESVIQHSGNVNGIKKPVYAGRDVSATPATGDAKIHKQELEQLLKDALDLSRVKNSYTEKYIGA